MASEQGGATIQHGVLVRQWKWPLRILFWWATIAACAWVGTLAVHWYWSRTQAPATQALYAQTRLAIELEQLSRLEPVLFDPQRLATMISRTVHDTGVDLALILSRALMNWPSGMRRNAASETIRNDLDPGGDFVRRQIEAAGDGWHLVVANTGLFGVRTATYLCALPLLAAALVLAVVDGLVARAKRKACAGHESAGIYHRAKLGVSFFAILAYISTLALPKFDYPAQSIFAGVVLVALLVRLQCSYYKKYL